MEEPGGAAAMEDAGDGAAGLGDAAETEDIGGGVAEFSGAAAENTVA